MSEPRTKAGRALRGLLQVSNGVDFGKRVAAIEAEAAEGVLLRDDEEGLRRLADALKKRGLGYPVAERYAKAILAALRETLDRSGVVAHEHVFEFTPEQGVPSYLCRCGEEKPANDWSYLPWHGGTKTPPARES